MKRGGPIKRYTPLKRSTKPLKRTRLRRVSKKHAAELRVYYDKRQAYLTKNEWCEAGPVILKAKLPPSYGVPYCTIRATQLHHVARRGPNLNNEETFCGCCAECHAWVHAHAQKARELGLLL